jgi:hypothetical protein
MAAVKQTIHQITLHHAGAEPSKGISTISASQAATPGVLLAFYWQRVGSPGLSANEKRTKDTHSFDFSFALRI